MIAAFTETLKMERAVVWELRQHKMNNERQVRDASKRSYQLTKGREEKVEVVLQERMREYMARHKPLCTSVHLTLRQS